MSKPRVSLPPGPSSGVNDTGWSGCGRSERTLTRVCKFQKTRSKHCGQAVACMVQAHCESTEGPGEQTVPGHGSRSSFFWVQFHLLPSTFILSGLQRLGLWEGLRDTGLGPSFLSCTGPPGPSFYLGLEEPGHGGPPGVFSTEFDKSIRVKTLRS